MDKKVTIFAIVMGCLFVLTILGTIGAICCLDHADRYAMTKISNERIADHIRIFHDGIAPENNVIKTTDGGRRVMCDDCIKRVINGNPYSIPAGNEYLVWIRGY